jgi:hypothetical protein
MTKLKQRTDNKNVVTVILGSIEPINQSKEFHCVSCGRIVCQYYTESRIIVIVGEMREVSRPLDIQCSRCKTIYRIA